MGAAGSKLAYPALGHGFRSLDVAFSDRSAAHRATPVVCVEKQPA
jgi:hypothetical protein